MSDQNGTPELWRTPSTAPGSPQVPGSQPSPSGQTVPGSAQAPSRGYQDPSVVRSPWDQAVPPGTGYLPRLETTGLMGPLYTAPTPMINTGNMAQLGADTTGSLPKVETTGSLSAMDTVVLRAYIDETAGGDSGGDAHRSEAPDEHRTLHVSHRAAWPAGWFKRVCQCLVVAVVAVAAAIGVGYIPSSSPKPVPLEVSSHIDLACPGITDLAGMLAGATSQSASWAGSSAAPVDRSGPVFSQAVTSASTLSGDGSLAGLVQFTQKGQSAAAFCTGPNATGTLQVSVADATLVMSNPDSADAVISVYLMGPQGDIEAKPLIDLTVPANTATTVNLADYAEGVAPLGITWQSTIGRVVAYAVVNTGTALDIVSPTRDDTEVVVPAVTSSGTVGVLLTNPALVRIQVSVEAITDQGTVAVVGGESVTLEARSTISLDLSAALQDETVALLVKTDKTVAATGFVQVGEDVASSPGVASSQFGRADMFGASDGPAKLVLANDTAASVVATITMASTSGNATQTATLAAGSSTSVDMPTGLQTIRVQAAPGVVAALVLQPVDSSGTANGISIVRIPPDTAWHGVTPLWIESQPS